MKESRVLRQNHMMLDKGLALQLQIIKDPAAVSKKPQSTDVTAPSSKLKMATSAMIFSSLVALASVQLSDLVYPVSETVTEPVVVVDEAVSVHAGTGYRHMSGATSNAVAQHISDTWKVNYELASNIVAVADETGFDADIDPIIVLAIIAKESSFNVNAKSHVGAEGLMQVFRKWHPEKFTGINKPTHEQNIVIGTAILKEYLERERGNLASALQRYNGASSDSQYTYSNKVLNIKTSFDHIYMATQSRKLTRS